jgi:hypothetical protein
LLGGIQSGSGARQQLARRHRARLKQQTSAVAEHREREQEENSAVFFHRSLYQVNH